MSPNYLPKEYLKGKKVLVAGLGVFGGGVSSAKWLLSQGAEVVVTDLKTAQELSPSIEQFTPRQKEKITFVLGRHRKNDFKRADVVVVNPGMPRESEYLKIAKDRGACLENPASLFFRFVQNPIVGITGTRGKSTTASFLAQLLGRQYPSVPAIGSTELPLFDGLEQIKKTPELPAVVELSSWQLEYLSKQSGGPDGAILTNFSADHLNSYRSMKHYASAKARIFRSQSKESWAIMNADDPWTPYFEKQMRGTSIYYISQKPLPKHKEGAYISRAGTLRLRLGRKDKKFFDVTEFEKSFGAHNLTNLLHAFLAAKCFDVNIPITKKEVLALEGVAFRQQVISETEKINIINDSAATSPQATVAALGRFSESRAKRSRGQDFILITGGTDKNLDYRDLAVTIKKFVPPKDLILLEGSATKKLVHELENMNYSKKALEEHHSLEACVQKARERATSKNATILFSPGAASFEKFKNEIDRGERFNEFLEKDPLSE